MRFIRGGQPHVSAATAFDNVVVAVREMRETDSFALNGDMRRIEYCRDAQRVAALLLDVVEIRGFADHVNYGAPLDVILRHRVGLAYISAGLYPVGRYFRRVPAHEFQVHEREAVQ